MDIKRIEIGGIGYKKGDIVRIIINQQEKKGHEQRENRPAIIVQNDISNKYLETTIVVPITDAKNIKKLGPNHVFLKGGIDGVVIDSIVLCQHIASIDIKERISAKIGQIGKDKISEIDNCLKVTLDIRD